MKNYPKVESMSSTHIISLFLILSLVRTVSSQAGLTNTLEGVGGTVRKSNRFVHTSLFARLGRSQRPNFITHFQGDLIVSGLGTIWRIDVNTREVTRLLDVNAAVQEESGGDRQIEFGNRQHGGLRSVAFHPKQTQFMYVSMMETRPSDPSRYEYLSNTPDAFVDSVLAEFRLSEDRRSVIPGSYRSVLRIGIPNVPDFLQDRDDFYDHPIKSIAFRGNQLYIAHGDAADQASSTGGGQNNDPFGKILRINPLLNTRRGLNYTVSRWNPFFNDPNMMNEVYALGFRNPHHICFGGGSNLFVAETGRATAEEVNIVKGGENFGWSRREGQFVFEAGEISDLPENDADFGFTYPAAAFGHLAVGTGQAIAGGCPITNASPMKGLYLYADFPVFGYLYFSWLGAMRRAKTKGNPSELTTARTLQPNICFDHDGVSTRVNTLKEIINLDPGFESKPRADIRIGRGPGGVMYWTSKSNDAIYVFESTKVNGDVSAC